MNKLALSAVLVLSTGLSSAAFAGERTGNGGFTPIVNLLIVTNPVVRNAICAFSGLEDNNGGTVTPGDTQTPHESGGTLEEPGVARVCSLLNYGKLK